MQNLVVLETNSSKAHAVTTVAESLLKDKLSKCKRGKSILIYYWRKSC